MNVLASGLSQLSFAFYFKFTQLDLLSAFTRTLSTSDDVEDRENEKGRLEEAYEKCDRDLDELIVQHYTELTTAIRTYQSITERITNSRNKIKQNNWAFQKPQGNLRGFKVKENLLSCKMLLHCKRDELRKLWIEGIEHKHVLNLLDEIENIKQVPQKLEQCMASKHYLSATDMLTSLKFHQFSECPTCSDSQTAEDALLQRAASSWKTK
ncbi:Exocyst complex component 4 [Saguinus oedipus]|uniref:Exocyst complex component Sec8 n=1 Tax=Saguinus oedipus TaxID=9490 RepID=A0ABQ9UHW4_SAGOE|nr:Exocyst complex component 4 [Saguinus oedipus]